MTDATAPEPSSRGAESSRPRPQYGEYATPEEQRARIQQPDVTIALDTGRPVEEAAVVAAPAGAAPSADVVPTRRRAVDRIVTFALLAYGLVNVVSSFPAFLDYSAYADTMFTVLGVEAELADPASGRPWGIAAALLLTVAWLATAAVSWWNLSRGRLTWWIPLVAGVLFTFLAGVLMVIPLLNDPAAWEAMLGSMR